MVIRTRVDHERDLKELGEIKKEEGNRQSHPVGQKKNSSR